MGYSVYIGRDVSNGPVVYVGITMQVPKRRFSWHKSNGKDLHFHVVSTGLTLAQAAEEENRLIAVYAETLKNQRGMKLPASYLQKEEVERRRSDPRWCAACLRRRVNKGYAICLRCDMLRRAQAQAGKEGT